MKAISLLIILTFFSCTHPDTPRVPLNSKDRQYQQCFEESDSYRNKNIRPKGQVMISFILHTDGKIDDEKIVSSDFRDANFHACLLEITRQLKLAPKAKETRTTKIINFSSKVKIYE